jgi:uncharacterized membrane protein YccC
MHSSANISQTDPHDVSPGLSKDVNSGLSEQDAELVARADERLAHAYEQIALADQQLARVNEQISKLESDGARKDRSRRPSRGRPALRGFIALLLTTGIFGAAFAWHSYGETAKPMISRWAPQLAAAAPLPLETPKLADEPSQPAVRVAAADAAIPLPAQTLPQETAASPIPPEMTQLLETMARDLANVQQQIEQLKAGQEALAHENARNAEQIKESQEQMARAIANVSEQNMRRTSVAPPLPAANPARKPVSALAPTEARAQARAPVRLQPRQQ